MVADAGVPRGFRVGARPEPEAAAAGSAAAAAAHAPFSGVDEALLAHAVPEAALRMQKAPSQFTDALLRLLLLVRPVAFGR